MSPISFEGLANSTPLRNLAVTAAWTSMVFASDLLCGNLGVRAQSVEYGALQQMFGEPVTTSVTGSPQRASEVPANIQIITHDEIRRSGADTIPDALQFLAGIDVRRYGSAQTEVAVRGYNRPYSSRLLVLVNGRQVYIDEYGFTAWQTLPVQLDEIRQIEVVKGPNSALFGFNAVGGVINIITFDPLKDSTNTATVRAGTHGYAGASAVGTIRFGDRGGVRLSAGGSRNDEFSTDGLPPMAVPYETSPFRYAFSAEGRFLPVADVELTAEFTAAKSQNFGVTNTPSFDPGQTFRNDSIKLGFTGDTNVGLIGVVAYRNGFKAEVLRGMPSVHLNSTVYVVQANDLFKIGAEHTIRLGIEFRDNEASGDLHGGTIGYNIYAASGMWDWKPSHALKFTNAVRIDHVALRYSGFVTPGLRYNEADYDGAAVTAFSFNTGLVYEPTATDTIRMTIGRGVQAPSLVDFGLQVSGDAGPFFVSFVGNPDLKPSSVMNYEVNYDHKISALHTALRVAAYYQNTSDLLASPLNAPLVPGPGGLAAYAANIGGSEAIGGEISLKGTNPSGMRWNVSYALISIENHLTIGALSEFASALDYEKGTPSSVFNFGAGYSWERFEVDGQGRWQSHYTDFRPIPGGATPFRVDNYFVLNARVGYRLTDKVNLALSGKQMARSRIFETASVPIERQIHFSLTVRLE